MKSVLLSVLFSIVTLFTYSQNAVAKIKYEQAEEAYQNGKYQEAIDYLNEAEKILKGPNTTTLYLKILSQNKVVETSNSVDFTLINSLRQNCASYLKSAEGSAELEDKFKEVYFISEGLKKYPKTQAEYDVILKKQQEEQEEKDRIAAEQREIERKKKEEQQRIYEAQQEAIRQKELRNVSYAAFKIGGTIPLNGNSRSTITYSQWSSTWSSSTNEAPFTTAIKKGKFGLNPGVTMGFNGIKGLDKISQKFKNKKAVMGIMFDLSQTFEFYNLDEIKGYPQNQSWYFEDYKKTPFSITSLGVGPSLSFRIGEKKTFIDMYFRVDMNLFTMGKYSSTYADASQTAEIAVYRAYIKIGASPTIGLNYRFKKMYIGAEFRLKVIDKSEFVDDFSYTYNNWGGSGSERHTYDPKGINLSYLSLNLGFIF